MSRHLFSSSNRIRLLAATASLILIAGGAWAKTTVHWLHLETNKEALAIWEQLVADYEAEHPDIDVQMQFLDNEAFKAKLPTLLQSDEAPDFFYTWGGGVLKEQSETGALKELTGALDADGSAWRNNYGPTALDGYTFDGKVWGVPYKSGTVSFFYNKALLEKAGVDGQAIKSWDDFLAAVEKVKAAGIVPIAGGGGDKWPLAFYWAYLSMRFAGKDIIGAAKNGEGDGFLDPAFIKAGEQLARLGKLEPFQPGYVGSSWNETLGAFGDGKAAILLGFENTEVSQRNSAADGVGLKQDNIGRFAFPVVEGAPGLVTDNLGRVNGWAVTKDASQEAIDFLKYLTGLEAEKKMAEAGMMIPVAKGAEVGVIDPLMRASVDQLTTSTWHQNFFDQDLGPAVGRVVNDITVEIVSGQMTPEEGAQAVQEAFELR